MALNYQEISQRLTKTFRLVIWPPFLEPVIHRKSWARNQPLLHGLPTNKAMWDTPRPNFQPSSLQSAMKWASIPKNECAFLSRKLLIGALCGKISCVLTTAYITIDCWLHHMFQHMANFRDSANKSDDSCFLRPLHKNTSIYIYPSIHLSIQPKRGTHQNGHVIEEKPRIILEDWRCNFNQSHLAA